jgi:hypothetical protein
MHGLSGDIEDDVDRRRPVERCMVLAGMLRVCCLELQGNPLVVLRTVDLVWGRLHCSSPREASLSLAHWPTTFWATVGWFTTHLSFSVAMTFK